MGYKAVLLYQDIPIKEWPPGVNGNFIFKIIDLPVSNQVPDKRPWRLWTAEQASQYSKELEDDFERNDEAFGKLSVDKQIKLALRRAEKFGQEMFEDFKLENVKAGLTKSEVRSMAKDLKDVEQLMRGGSLKALLEELVSLDLLVLTYLTEERVLKYGNAVRQYLGLGEVETQAELDDGVT